MHKTGTNPRNLLWMDLEDVELPTGKMGGKRNLRVVRCRVDDIWEGTLDDGNGRNTYVTYVLVKVDHKPTVLAWDHRIGQIPSIGRTLRLTIGGKGNTRRIKCIEVLPARRPKQQRQSGWRRWIGKAFCAENRETLEE